MEVFREWNIISHCCSSSSFLAKKGKEKRGKEREERDGGEISTSSSSFGMRYESLKKKLQ